MEISNKNLKNILTTITIIVILIAIVNLFLGRSEKLNSEIILKQNYGGVIVKKYLDSLDHNGNKIVFKTKKKQPIHWKASSYIDIGDSISKKRNQSILNIFKKDGSFFQYDLINNEVIKRN